MSRPKRQVELRPSGNCMRFVSYSGPNGDAKWVPGLTKKMCEVFGLTFSSCHTGIGSNGRAREHQARPRGSSKRRINGAMQLGSLIDSEIGVAFALMRKRTKRRASVPEVDSKKKKTLWRVVTKQVKEVEAPVYCAKGFHPFTRRLLHRIDKELGLCIVNTQLVVWWAAPALIATAVDVVAFDNRTQKHVVIEVKICRLSKKDYEGPGGNAPRNLPPAVKRALGADAETSSLAFTHQMQLCNTLRMFNKSHPHMATDQAFVITVNSTEVNVHPLWPPLLKHSDKVFAALSSRIKKKRKTATKT